MPDPRIGNLHTFKRKHVPIDRPDASSLWLVKPCRAGVRSGAPYPA